MADALERLKILLNSSTPIVVMETVEEMRAVRLVRVACSSLNLATFEWSIASGLVRKSCFWTMTARQERCRCHVLPCAIWFTKGAARA